MPALIESLPYNLDFCIGGEPTSKHVLGDCLKIGRRGVLQGTVKLLGRAGHAAYADRTPNIISSLPAVLGALGEPWHDQLHGVATTLAVTNIITDSTAVNVIPGCVTLSFDTRFSPHRTVAEIESEVIRRLNATSIPYELAISKSTNPYLSDCSPEGDPRQRALVESARKAIREVTGEEPSLSCDGGMSDARFTAQRWIPTVEFGVPHGGMHGPNEYVASRDVRLLEVVYVRLGEMLASF
jgi:succinyl-diaminopimelate desuccinylase